MSVSEGTTIAELLTNGMTANTPIQGKIEKIFPTYGFAVSNEGQRFFFHFGTCVSKPECFQVGDDVEFFLGQDAKSGRLHAQRVRQFPLGGGPAILRSSRSTDPISPSIGHLIPGLIELPASLSPKKSFGSNSFSPMSVPHAVLSSESGFNEVGAPDSPHIISDHDKKWVPSLDRSSSVPVQIKTPDNNLMVFPKNPAMMTSNYRPSCFGADDLSAQNSTGTPIVHTTGVVVQVPSDAVYQPMARGKIAVVLEGKCEWVEFQWISLKFPQEKPLVAFGVQVEMLVIRNQRLNSLEARQLLPVAPILRGLITIVNTHNNCAVIEVADQPRCLTLPLKFYLGHPKDITPNTSVQFIVVPSPKGDLASRLTVLPRGSVNIFQVEREWKYGILETPPRGSHYPGFLKDSASSERIHFECKDWNITHAFGSGDVFKYRLRLDTRTKEQTATDIRFDPETSFKLNGEPRERGRVVEVVASNGVWVQCQDTRPKKAHQSQQMDWGDVTGLVWVPFVEFLDHKTESGFPTVGTPMDITISKSTLPPRLRGERALILAGEVKSKLSEGVIVKVAEKPQNQSAEQKNQYKGAIMMEYGHRLTYRWKDLLGALLAVGNKVEFFVRSTKEGKSRAVSVRKHLDVASDPLLPTSSLARGLIIDCSMQEDKLMIETRGSTQMPSLSSSGSNPKEVGDRSPTDSGYAGTPTMDSTSTLAMAILGAANAQKIKDEELLKNTLFLPPMMWEASEERRRSIIPGPTTGYVVVVGEREGSTTLLIELRNHQELVRATDLDHSGGWKKGDEISLDMVETVEGTVPKNIRKLPKGALDTLESGETLCGNICSELVYDKEHYGGFIEVTDEEGISGHIRFTLHSLIDTVAYNQMNEGRMVFFRIKEPNGECRARLAVDVRLA